MNPLELPQCRQRGPEFFPGRWMCRSSRVVAFQGTTAELCRASCPYVDHEDERPARAIVAPSGGEGHGVAIGTYDSLHPPRRRFGTHAVELNLTVLRRTCGPAVKVLVCDDASPPRSQRRYRELCDHFGAEFTTNQERMGHSSGDMIVFHKAIEWAARLGLQTVTKLSHRMVIDVPGWVQHDSRALVASGFGTQAQMLANFGLEQVRTECVMMVVDRWYSAGVLEHFRPRAIPFWNETHTFSAIARFVDPRAPYPGFLPWPRLAFYRGADRPPTFFREMHGNAPALFRDLARRHGVSLSGSFSTIDSCRSLDYQ